MPEIFVILVVEGPPRADRFKLTFVIDPPEVRSFALRLKTTTVVRLLLTCAGVTKMLVTTIPDGILITVTDAFTIRGLP